MSSQAVVIVFREQRETTNIEKVIGPVSQETARILADGFVASGRVAQAYGMTAP